MQTSWEKVWEEAEALADRWKTEEDSRCLSSARIVLPALPLYQGLKALLAALIAKKDLVFDEKSGFSAESGDRVIPLDSRESEDFLSLRGQVPGVLWELLDGRQFTFATSGSTGVSQLITKSAEGLKNEVYELAKLYQPHKGKFISSLVRPFHIYGFLHSFLLPLYRDCEVFFWNAAKGLPSLETGFPRTNDLLITVPAHFNLLTLIWDFAETRVLVSSGAPLGSKRELRVLELKEHFEQYWEILGSTETGGLAYRLVDRKEAFKLFPGIHFQSEKEGTRIFSPFLAPESNVLSQDDLELNREGELIHRGRKDRVFKYGGMRYSLTEMEHVLAEICEGQTVICAFEERQDTAQGGILSAWIEGPRKDLRKNFPAHLPYPKRLVFLDTFPRDSQGKVSLEALRSHSANSSSPVE